MLSACQSNEANGGQGTSARMRTCVYVSVGERWFSLHACAQELIYMGANGLICMHLLYDIPADERGEEINRNKDRHKEQDVETETERQRQITKQTKRKTKPLAILSAAKKQKEAKEKK